MNKTKRFLIFIIINQWCALSFATQDECNCSYQKCIEFNEIQSPNGNIKREEIELIGISGVKNFTHDVNGLYSGITLYFEQAICMHGELYTPGDAPQPQMFVIPNMTHIQLITHGDQANQFSGKNKGERFIVKGKVDYAISAYHLTSLLLDVTSIKKAVKSNASKL